MIEKARIVSREKEEPVKTVYRVSCLESEACHKCSGSMFCKISDKSFEAADLKKRTFEVGDKVTVFFPAKDTVLVSFLVLILPLLAFIAGFFLAGALKIENEILGVLFGFTAMVLCGIGVFFFLRQPRFQRLPTILEKINIPED